MAPKPTVTGATGPLVTGILPESWLPRADGHRGLWGGQAPVWPRRFSSASLGVEPSERRFSRVVDERHRLRHGMMASDLSDGCVHALTHPTVRLVALGLVRSSSMWIASRALNCIE